MVQLIFTVTTQVTYSVIIHPCIDLKLPKLKKDLRTKSDYLNSHLYAPQRFQTAWNLIVSSV